jgi:hypothetical protein
MTKWDFYDLFFKEYDPRKRFVCGLLSGQRGNHFN